MRQTFDRAYVTRTSDFGEDQIVLVSAPIDKRTPDQPGKLIEPVTGPPLHAVLHIRLHWRPQTTSLASQAALNAVLHWYVFTTPDGGGGAPPSLLHYVGTAFVRLTATDAGADVTMTDGSLALHDRVGNLRDPLGAFTVDGTFHAVTGDRNVADVLADVRKVIAEAAPTPTPATRP